MRSQSSAVSKEGDRKMQMTLFNIVQTLINPAEGPHSSNRQVLQCIGRLTKFTINDILRTWAINPDECK